MRPRDPETKRPYRLYHAQAKIEVPRRRYKTAWAAHVGALKLIRWDLRVGETLEVINAHYGRLVFSYTRVVDGCKWGIHNAVEGLQTNRGAQEKRKARSQEGAREGEWISGNDTTK